MKNPRIVDAMEHIDDDLITEAVSYRPNRNRISIATKRIAVAACVTLMISVLVAIPTFFHIEGVISVFPNKNTHNDHSFNGFILTAYAVNDVDYQLTENIITDTNAVVMLPHIEILLGKYSPLTSSVPGFPFKFDVEGRYKIEVSAEKGTLCRWDQETGIITECGKSTSYNKGEILYWEPISEDGNLENASTITVVALHDGKTVAKQNISITADAFPFYSACLDDPELS